MELTKPAKILSFSVPPKSPNKLPTTSQFPTNRRTISSENETERARNAQLSLSTMSDIMVASTAQNLNIELQKLGPFFRIIARSLLTEREVGRAEGLIRVCVGGKILHLDSMRLKRETLGMEKSIFGISLVIGAAAIRYGYDCGCRKAELLAINDSDLYHSKVRRFYKRLGFEEVYEVKGSTLGYLIQTLVGVGGGGGFGTRMDADIENLMIKWFSRFNKSKQSNLELDKR